MHTLGKGLQYLVGMLTGLIMAFLATGLVSYAIFPPDGPVGEGLIMLVIYLFFCCACVPGYVFLMDLHMRGRTDSRRLVACEVMLRASVIVGASLLCLILVKLPTATTTKWFACVVGVFACTWAISPAFWRHAA